MQELQLSLNQDIITEFSQFGQKLKEELNKEREQFIIKYEEDETAAMEEYGVTTLEIGGIIELLIDTENKDAVEELVTQFIERIDAEAGIKDALMTKGWKTEW